MGVGGGPFHTVGIPSDPINEFIHILVSS